MSWGWGKPRKGGWTGAGDEQPVSRFSQIIHTVLEVVAGGVIRAGKTGWDDDAHTGFWLGVCEDRVARFSVGGPGFWLKWDGQALRLLGYIWVKGGADGPNWLQFIGDDGETCGYVLSHDAWGHQVEIGVPRQDAADDPSMIDIFCDGDFGASVRLRCVTYRGQGKDGARFSIIVGNQESFAVDGYGNVIANSYLTVPDAVAPAQAVNLKTADSRYAGSAHTHSLGQLTQSGAEVGQVAAWNGASWAPAAAAGGGVSDHGGLSGLGDDDHAQYLTSGRGDVRYSLLGHTHPAGTHGALSGLGDDDHLQYHTDARGDARYSLLGHTHPAGDHGALLGLGDDDHPQYLAKSTGITKTVTVGVGRSMTFVNGQLTGTVGL